MPSASSSFFAGVRAVLPILVGAVPFGLVYGITALEAGISPVLAQAMSALVFAGSAQFIVAQLYSLDAPALVLALTVVVVNLRHLLYSASIAPYFRELSFSFRSWLAYFLTDETYAVCILRFQINPDARAQGYFFLGAGTALWSTWQLSTAAGILVGAAVPETLPLDFALPLTFIALVVPAVRDRASLAAAAAAAIVAVLTVSMPYQLGLLVATVAGTLLGMVVAERSASITCSS